MRYLIVTALACACAFAAEIHDPTIKGTFVPPYVTVAPSGSCSSPAMTTTLLAPGAPSTYTCTPTSGTSCPCTWVQSSGAVSINSSDGFVGRSYSGGTWDLTAGTNSALQDGNNNFSGATAYPTSATQTLSSSASRILANATKVSISCSSALTLTGANIIADSVRDGQELIITNAGSNDCILTSGSTENLQLSGSTVTISSKRHLRLIYDLANSIWTQAVGSNSGGGTGCVPSGTAIQKGDGSGGCVAAVAGTDYDVLAPITKVIGKGGSTTTYTITAEAAAGVAPNVSASFGTVSTGDVIMCRWSIQKQDPSANGTAELMRVGIWINNTYAGGSQEFNTTSTGSPAGQMASATILINSTSSVTTLVEGRQFSNNQAIVPEFYVGPRSISLTGSNTIEIRPYILSGLADGSFSLNFWACTLTGPNQ